MQKETAQKLLKIFGVLNYIFGAILVLLSIIFFANIIPNLNTEMTKIVTIDWHGIEPNIAIGVYLIVNGMFTLLEGWALCRAAKDSTKTTLALVLTVLSLVASIIGLFVGKIGVSQISSLVIDAILVYSVFIVRKEA